MPDQERDPLIGPRRVPGQALHRVDGEAKVKGRGPFHRRIRCLRTSPTRRWSTAPSPRAESADRYRTGQARAGGVLEVLTYKNMPSMKAPPLVDFNDLKKGMAASDLPILQDAFGALGRPAGRGRGCRNTRTGRARRIPGGGGVRDRGRRPFRSTERNPTAVEPSDVMGEPPWSRSANVEKGIARGGCERRSRLSHAAVQPQRHRAARDHRRSGMTTARLPCSMSTQSVNTAAHTLALIFGLEARDDVQVVAPFVAAASAARAGCGTTRRFARPPRKS